MFLVRGIAVCLAVFFLAAAAANVFLLAIAPLSRRCARPLPANKRAALLFATALAPLWSATLLTFGIALPAFAIFEPRWAAEPMGVMLPVLSAGGLLLFAAMAAQLVRLQWRSWRTSREWQRRSQPLLSPSPDFSTLQVATDGALLGTVGVLRPRVFASRELVGSLSETELAAALAHEAGHIASADNLKRLLLAAVAGVGFAGRVLGLRDEWSRAAEIAADEAALRAGVSPLDLAAALVKAGRLRFNSDAARLTAVSHLVAPAANSEVEERVRHLLARVDGIQPAGARSSLLPWTCATAVAVLIGYVVYFMPLMQSAHELLEQLVR